MNVMGDKEAAGPPLPSETAPAFEQNESWGSRYRARVEKSKLGKKKAPGDSRRTHQMQVILD
jgi:hypothetical protein